MKRSASNAGKPAALILGAAEDPQVRRVSRAIRALGGRVVFCDTAAFPATTHISLRDGDLRIGRRVVPPLQSVYLRGLNVSPRSTECEDELRTRPHGFLAQCDEKRALLVSLVQILARRGVRIVNPIEVNGQHGAKPYQLELLRGAGLPVPRSLASNDPAAVRRFMREVERAVYKPLGGGATVRAVNRDDLNDERLELLRNAPVLFQEYIEGIAVRAYVVDGRVVGAAEIHSEELDYRRGEEHVIATELTREERRMAATAAKACGMIFSGVDLIRAGDATWVLECNPSPMFAVFERKTGLNIAQPLARLLVGR